MLEPGRHTESETLTGYLAMQLQSIRNAAHGLTEEQARSTPCRSALSVGGLVKHATYVMTGLDRRRTDPAALPDESSTRLFVGSFALEESETLEGTLAEFDRVREAYLAEIGSTDPGGETIEPPAPWDGRMTPAEVHARFFLVHHIEELARHAGHADIIREQIDGAAAYSLDLAVEGKPGNDYVKPWTPPQD